MQALTRHIEVFADPPAVAHAAAEWMTEVALEMNASFRVALSGGSSPKLLYELLASNDFRSRFPWSRVHWYWGDERFVPYSRPESNFRLAYDAMLAKVPAPPENIHPVPVDGAPEAAAARYEQILQEAYGAAVLDPARPLFDLTLLGLGVDGHTASLLPGDHALRERKRWVTVVAQGHPETRITMTYPAIESSRRVAFIVTGHEKASILRLIRTGASDAPAARLAPLGEMLWFVDRAATGAGTGP